MSASISKIAQVVLEQTELILQDVHKNAVQAYIKYKAYYDKKTITSKLKQADIFNVLQPKADDQVRKIPFTDFRWIEPYLTLPNNGCFVRKISTNNTQVLHRLKLRQFTTL